VKNGNRTQYNTTQNKQKKKERWEEPLMGQFINYYRRERKKKESGVCLI